MKILFFLENIWYGNGSANAKASWNPFAEVESPVIPESNLYIDGVAYTCKYVPRYHYRMGRLDVVEMIVRPNGGEAELKWHRNEHPYESVNRDNARGGIHE